MKRLLKFFSALKRLYVTSAPAGAAVPYVLGLIFVFFYFVDHTHPDEAYLICGAVMFLAGLFIQIGFSVNRGINGTPADYLSDYDKDVIGTAFMYGEKKRMFYSALELLLAENNYNDALDIFRDLKGKNLTDSEQGVLGFLHLHLLQQNGILHQRRSLRSYRSRKGDTSPRIAAYGGKKLFPLRKLRLCG